MNSLINSVLRGLSFCRQKNQNGRKNQIKSLKPREEKRREEKRRDQRRRESTTGQKLLAKGKTRGSVDKRDPKKNKAFLSSRAASPKQI